MRVLLIGCVCISICLCCSLVLLMFCSGMLSVGSMCWLVGSRVIV